MAGKVKLLCVCGPTASGKTTLAVELAKRLNGEVVSADSMQIYKGLHIGTAAPSREEMQGVPHHLIGVLEPGTPCSAADYAAMAGQAVQEISARGRLPVLCGGTKAEGSAAYGAVFSSGRATGPAGTASPLRV